MEDGECVCSARKGCEKEEGHKQMSVRFETKKQEGVIRTKNDEYICTCVRVCKSGWERFKGRRA
jgi:hypothetical protein